MKIVVTGTRGIPNIMGGVETHCEELFPRIARKGFEVTVIRRKSYVRDTLSSYKGITLSDIETPRKKSLEAIVHTFRAIVRAKSRHRPPPCGGPGTADTAGPFAGNESRIHPPRAGLRPGQMGHGGQNGTPPGRGRRHALRQRSHRDLACDRRHADPEIRT